MKYGYADLSYMSTVWLRAQIVRYCVLSVANVSKTYII